MPLYCVVWLYLDAHTWTEHDDEEAEELLVCTIRDKVFTSFEQKIAHREGTQLLEIL